jgi:hypothetical protein
MKLFSFIFGFFFEVTRKLIRVYQTASNKLVRRECMRAIVPSQSDSVMDSRREIVSDNTKPNSFARQVIESPDRPPIVVRHEVLPVEEAKPKIVRKEIVNPEPEADRAPASPPPRRVKLAETVGKDKFAAIRRDIADRELRRRAIPLEDIIRRDPCFVYCDDEGRFRWTRSQCRIAIEYRKSTKPLEKEVTRDNQTHPSPKIFYAQGDEFGKPFAFLTHDAYVMDEWIDGREVHIFDSGMLVEMRREQKQLEDGRMRNRWVYRPCDRDENILNLPLVGKLIDHIDLQEVVDQPMRAFSDIAGKPIVMYDVKKTKFAFVVEVVEEGVSRLIGCAVVVDRDKKTRIISFDPANIPEKEMEKWIHIDLQKKEEVPSAS